MMIEMNLRSKDLLKNLNLGIRMLEKNKVAFLPTLAHPLRNDIRMPRATNAVAYYPGCSLHSTAKEFDISTRAVCKTLELKLIEPKGWVCCGSSAAHCAEPLLAVRLPMENLALIEKSGFKEVTMPCAACFNRHKTALYEIHHDEQCKKDIDEILDYCRSKKLFDNELETRISEYRKQYEIK